MEGKSYCRQGVNSNGKDERMRRKLWVKITAVLVAVIMLDGRKCQYICRHPELLIRKGIVYQNNKVYTAMGSEEQADIIL